MTYNQLHLLSEDELGLVLYVINIIDPPCCPKMTFEYKHLVWFKQDAIVHKLLGVGDKITDEYRGMFVDLMKKFNVKVEYKAREENKLTEVPPTGSIASNESS